MGYSGSLIFYDSMLSDITDADRMDHVSSQGYAWGYIGSCIPFAGCLALVLGAGALGLSMVTAMGALLRHHRPVVAGLHPAAAPPV